MIANSNMPITYLQQIIAIGWNLILMSRDMLPK